MRRITVILVLGLLVFVSGCGSSNSSSSSSPASAGQTTGAQSTAPATTGSEKVRFAKTKFLLHAGLAFGAFHRYIYKPFKRGTYRAGSGFKKARILIKGGLAALFVYHEVKLALTDAKSSPLLSKLVSPLTALGSTMQGLAGKLRGGQAQTADVEKANGQVASVSKQSAGAGAPITEGNPPASLAPTG